LGISGVDVIAIKIQLPVVRIFTVSVFQISGSVSTAPFSSFSILEFRPAGAT
jgi:hypothetical protein